ncbi:hypothetical protein EON83_26335 [bacterium]|nr:MAG: hypothetical protein EON83_26335 [bacterium]
MFPTPLKSEASWYELAYFAERAGVSIEHICATVEAATQVARQSTSAHKGGNYQPVLPYENDLDAVIGALRDDGFDLEIKDVQWNESQHPRDDDGRFTNGGSHLYRGALADARIDRTYIVHPTIPPAQYSPPLREMTADQALDEVLKKGRELRELAVQRQVQDAKKGLSKEKLKAAKELLSALQQQVTSNEAEKDSLRRRMEAVGKEVQRQGAIERAELKDIATLRQILYVHSPAELNVRFDTIPGKNMQPLTSNHLTEAALTGSEEIRRLVSEHLYIGDIYFERETRPDTRSNYEYGGRVKLTDEVGTRIVVHEFGHALEDLNPTVRQKVLDFRTKRTRGEGFLSLQSTNSAFRPDEVYKKDRFLDAYMGKFYIGSDDTEILSMGLEYFHSDPLTLAEGDPEYFKFIYDLVRGK